MEVDFVVIEVESLGGGFDESLFIVEVFCDVEWVEIVVFILEKVISGVVVVLLGCDWIFM